MSEHEQHPDENPEPEHPHGETLPAGSPTEGEAQLEKPYSDFEGAKAGKGGDHPTPGAGEHDDPNA